MTPDHVKPELIEVLSDIQRAMGHEVAIDGSTCPAADLEDFDSLIWPTATGELANKLGVNIPNDTHVFVTQDRKRSLTVDQIAARVCEVLIRRG